MNGNRIKIYSVVELTRLIKDLLEGEVGAVWVEGEVSNFRQPSSGHCYFTLRDEFSQIAAVLFRGDQRMVKCPLRDGIRVRIFGDLTVYERNGNYQIIVRRAEEAGRGALQARFEELKDRLRKEGLFADERKKPIPLLPQHVGVVTSPTGAAIRDILHVVTRRFPNLHVVLAPVKVQGEGAAEEIAAALDLLNRRGGLDVIIVGRGGGSLEDLWCFNEEVVARAIARSAIPVISAVGHETDFTISDFVADLRAPTPSAAAELVVGRKEDFEASLRDLSRHIVRLLKGTVLEARNRVLTAGGSPVFGEPRGVVSGYAKRVEGLGLRAAHCAEGCVRDRRQSVDDLGLRLLHEAKIWRQSCQQEIRRLETQFRALNPLAVLERGYSITSDEAGRALRSAAGLRVGQGVVTRLARGRFASEVTSKTD